MHEAYVATSVIKGVSAKTIEPNCIRVLISKSRRSCILQCVRGGQGGTLGFSQKAVLSWLSLVQVSLGEGFVTGKAFGIQA